MLIGVDWGTTHLRAVLMDEGGRVALRQSTDKGLMRVADGAFEATLAAAIAPLRERAIAAPVWMAGMVGSRRGWREAPYVPVPATLDQLAAAAMPVAAPTIGDVMLVPGVCQAAPADVMRGEETEVFGALDLMGLSDATVVLPGTHAKWVRIQAGAIVQLRTFLTGDLFEAVRRHTILAQSVGEDRGDEAALRDGFARGAQLNGAGDLLTALFSVRAEGLLGGPDGDAAASLLSGLLIGAEVASGAAGLEQAVLVGTGGLERRYRMALEAAGVEVAVAPDNSQARGLALMAARVG